MAGTVWSLRSLLAQNILWPYDSVLNKVWCFERESLLNWLALGLAKLLNRVTGYKLLFPDCCGNRTRNTYSGCSKGTIKTTFSKFWLDKQRHTKLILKLWDTMVIVIINNFEHWSHSSSKLNFSQALAAILISMSVCMPWLGIFMGKGCLCSMLCFNKTFCTKTRQMIPVKSTFLYYYIPLL